MLCAYRNGSLEACQWLILNGAVTHPVSAHVDQAMVTRDTKPCPVRNKEATKRTLMH